MKKRIKSLIISIGILSTLFFSVPTLAVETETNIETMNTVQPRTDIKEWYYKIENGNLYKRLFNCSTGRWETDWIFVMSGVEEL